jgi:serine phosphatase RsbU (regulator of sigma subunit)
VLDQREGQGEIWVGGVPDVLLFGEDGRLQRRFGSSSLPLGILKTTEIAHAIEHFTWQSAGQLMLVSDGIVEASNAEDVAFGEARLIETLESRAPGLAMSEALQQSLQAYLGGSVAHDDMSMLVIDCPRAGSIA